MELTGAHRRPDVSSLVAVGLLVAAGPFLALPELVPAGVRTAVVVSLTLAALGVALTALREARAVCGCAAVLGVMIVAGYLRATPSADALAKFAGAGVGVLAMAAVASFCRSDRRLALAAMGFAALGIGVLLVGLAGARKPPSKFFEAPGLYETMEMRLRLGLPGMREHGWVNLNALAGTALLIAPVGVALALGLARRGVHAPILRATGFVGLAAAAVAVFVVFFSQSRAAWIAAWLLLLPFGLRYGRRWVPVPVVLAACVVVTVSAGALMRVAAPSSFARASALATRSAEQRLSIWRQGAGLLAASPLTGIGLGEFRRVYQPPPGRKQRPAAHAHNIFLQTGLDIGLVGLGAYLGLLGLVLARAREAAAGPSPLASAAAAGAGIALVAGLLFGLGDAIALGAKVGIFQWLAAGLALAGWQVQKGTGRFR